MAGLTDILSGNIGQEYQQEDPYFLTGVNIAKTPIPTPQDNSQAILMPLLKGLLAGGLIGYGKSNALNAQYHDESAVPAMQGMISASQIGPVADPTQYAGLMNKALSGDYTKFTYGEDAPPEGWNPKIGQSDLIKALQDKAQADELKSKVTSSVLDSAVKDGTLTPSQALAAVSGKTSDLQAALGAEAVGGETPKMKMLLDSLHITGADRAGLKTPEDVQLYMIHGPGAQKQERNIKSADTAVAATGGMKSIDRLINMVDDLPDSGIARAVEGISPLTNKVNFFDDQAKSQSAALAKQLEGRVNQTTLQSYLDSMARQTGDTKQDLKNRLVNAQLWLSQIAQGNTKASEMDPAEFAKARGVNPQDIGIKDSSLQQTKTIGSTTYVKVPGGWQAQ